MSIFKWEYRVINLPSTNGGEDYFAICEVTYDKNGDPKGYAPVDKVGEVSHSDLTTAVYSMMGALSLPILEETDFKQIPWGEMKDD